MPSMPPSVTPATNPSPISQMAQRLRDLWSGTSDRAQAQRDALLAFLVRVVSAGLGERPSVAAGRMVVAGPGVAWPKSRCSGCEPAALATESFPGCPPGPVIAGGAAWRASWRSRE